MHLTEEGNRRIAESLAQPILENAVVLAAELVFHITFNQGECDRISPHARSKRGLS